MKFFFILIIAAWTLTGCRSDADYMAEFCLNFDKTVSLAGDDCSDMAQRLTHFLDDSHTKIADHEVCNHSTACLPCQSAVNRMLRHCGYDEALKPIYQRMHFSKTLRHSMTTSQEEERP